MTSGPSPGLGPHLERARRRTPRATLARYLPGVIDDDAMARLLGALSLDPEAPQVAYALERVRAGDRAALARLVLCAQIWAEVADEAPGSAGAPRWIERWLELEPSGFPMIDVAALRRLLDAGVDVDDLTDVVRSAQVLQAWNVVSLLDDPTAIARGIGPDVAATLAVTLALEGDGGTLQQPVGSLHEDFPDLDPSGRATEPRTPVLRAFGALSIEDRAALVRAIAPGREQSPVHAAQRWMDCTGGSIEEARAAVAALRAHLSLPLLDRLRPARRGER